MNETLKMMKVELCRSHKVLNLIHDFNINMSNEMRLLNQSLSSPISLICRTYLDSWQGEIQNQIFQNEFYCSTISQASLLIEGDADAEMIRSCIQQLAFIDASMKDHTDSISVSRPVDGLIPASFDDSFFSQIKLHNNLSFDVPKSWEYWVFRLKENSKILLQLAKVLPINHPLGTFPSTIHMMIGDILSICIEQARLVRTLKIISEDQSPGHGAFLRLECLLIQEEILPLPYYCEDEEE